LTQALVFWLDQSWGEALAALQAELEKKESHE